MAIFSCMICHHHFQLNKINRLTTAAKQLKSTSRLNDFKTEIYGLHFGSKLTSEWSFARGSRAIHVPNFRSFSQHRSLRIHASWFVSERLAKDAFTFGTTAVLPFYILMVAAPKAELTKKCMRSNIPNMVLGILYAYLVYLSWTPDTVRLLFSGKYWSPELPGIAKMFSNEMTLASVWIHLLAIDLFAARQVYHDGLENNIETRHSVSLCLLSCPIGILVHAITKALIITYRASKTKIQ